MNEFEKLCQQNQETVYRYLLALCRDEHLAEELTAETFIVAFLHIDRFRGECKVMTWLCQIAKNAYLKEQKKRSRQTALETAFDLADTAHFTDRLCEKRAGDADPPNAAYPEGAVSGSLYSTGSGQSKLSGNCGNLLQNRRLGKGHLLSGKGNIDTENGGRT